MLPIGDRNPTRRAPVLTVLFASICVAVYVAFLLGRHSTIVQTEAGPLELVASDAFTLEWAAVPCEVLSAQPLSVREVTATFVGGQQSACEWSRRDDPLFLPAKHVFAALVTSMFLHGGLVHLAGNLLFLWIFGNNVEDRLGPMRYLAFYLGGGVVATMAHVLTHPASTVPLVGASGAIAAVMGAYLVWYPRAPVRVLVLFVVPLTVRASWFLLAWFFAQFLVSSGSAVAWVAHVSGFVWGVLVARAAHRRPPSGDPDPPGWVGYA